MYTIKKLDNKNALDAHDEVHWRVPRRNEQPINKLIKIIHQILFKILRFYTITDGNDIVTSKLLEKGKLIICKKN